MELCRNRVTGASLTLFHSNFLFNQSEKILLKNSANFRRDYQAMRDLVRARESAAEDQRCKRQLISAFLLRHGRLYHRPKTWTMRYRRWLQQQSFDHPAQQIALQEMVLAERHA